MEGKNNCGGEDFWSRKIKEHWIAFIIFIIGCIIAAIGAVFVLFWFIETSSIGSMGTATIGEWSLAWIWQFFIYLILWELLIIGIPVAISFGIGWYIFSKSLSDEEKEEFKNREKKKHHGTSASSGFSFMLFITFSIYMYIKGDFFTPFGDYAYSYWVYSFFQALAWLLILCGIPAAIILTIVYFKIWRKN